MFWLAVGLFTLLIALIAFYPLLRTATNIANQLVRDQLNKTFYLDRLQELEREQQQGLIDDVEQMKIELQQNLLQDIPAKNKQKNQQITLNKLWFVSAFIGLIMTACLVYFKVGSWQQQQMLDNTYHKLPFFYQRLKEEQTNPLNLQEMKQFATALRIELQHNSQNAQNWFLLGQLGMAMDDGQLTFDSYAKAYKLAPDNIQYQLAYARILMFSQDEQDKIEGEQLLKRMIRRDHSNTDALSLLAFRYFEQENYQLAILSWTTMLKLITKDDSRRQLLEKSIQSAKNALAQQRQKKQNEK